MIQFEWDPRKDLLNQRKHGISFEEAQTVFIDERAWIEFDEAHSDTEERFRILGLSDRANILVVVHCVRDDTVIRIISARHASAAEQIGYKRRATIW